MECPRSKTPLKKINVGKVPVYVSEQCGGVFLESSTLSLFECPTSERGQALVNHLSQFHDDTLDLSCRISCPSCADTVMLRRYHSPLHVVEIDECPGCGAIWLDTGELSKLQSLMLNEKERSLLRAQMLEQHRTPNIESMPYINDYWIKREKRIGGLMEIAGYLTRFW
ncbi:zf-TFIIB domain-containing protein [Glaciecola sp. MH2013]|uniref:TFIIB-type zinc ribbon-containing protein n=1 Tax=Glaciecola sp. MH2013 TaxID=2785524 RepID=UPI00189EAF4B|nr:zf-TFIIB domain-containing protein [Glaciecola sp. MH2013]MBF7074451.1 zf-TFIIB domain-containing protein [Glaciecola sp. MH2013]